MKQSKSATSAANGPSTTGNAQHSSTATNGQPSPAPGIQQLKTAFHVPYSSPILPNAIARQTEALHRWQPLSSKPIPDLSVYTNMSPQFNPNTIIMSSSPLQHTIPQDSQSLQELVVNRARRVQQDDGTTDINFQKRDENFTAAVSQDLIQNTTVICFQGSLEMQQTSLPSSQSEWMDCAATVSARKEEATTLQCSEEDLKVPKLHLMLNLWKKEN